MLICNFYAAMQPLNISDFHVPELSGDNCKSLMLKLSSMKLTNISGVHEHIIKMRDIAAQFKKFEVEIPDNFLVDSILNSLPPQYEPFKISYNTHKQKWSICIGSQRLRLANQKWRFLRSGLSLGEVFINVEMRAYTYRLSSPH